MTYLEMVKEDVLEYVKNEIIIDDYEREELEEKLNEELWVEDSVTGNASGSYTFNRYEAEKIVKDNISDVVEACCEFGIDSKAFGEKVFNEEWEYLDVTARCYFLGQAISEALDELEL